MARWLTTDAPVAVTSPTSGSPRDHIPILDPTERYRERMSAAQASAADAGLSAILVGVGADLGS